MFSVHVFTPPNEFLWYTFTLPLYLSTHSWLSHVAVLLLKKQSQRGKVLDIYPVGAAYLGLVGWRSPFSGLNYFHSESTVGCVWICKTNTQELSLVALHSFSTQSYPHGIHSFYRCYCTFGKEFLSLLCMCEVIMLFIYTCGFACAHSMITKTQYLKWAYQQKVCMLGKKKHIWFCHPVNNRQVCVHQI